MGGARRLCGRFPAVRFPVSLKRVLSVLGLAGRDPPQAPWRGQLYDSPLHRWLDDEDFPWRATRAELAALYGVHPHPAYKWPMLSVPTPMLDGLIYPLAAHADARYPLSVPAAEFSGHASLGPDARVNLRHVYDQLAPHLGPTRVEPYNNTVRAEWAFGRAGLTLMAWPEDLNRGDRGRNDAHERDPRLKTACSITLDTGFRPVPTPQELAWLESFSALARIRPEGADTPASLRAGRVGDLDLGHVRELPVGLERLIGQIGLSGDGQALILCDRRLCLVPLSRLAAFRIDQYGPGRSGPGGSYLTAQYRAEDPAGGLKPIGISWQGPDTAEQLAEKLAAATGRPLEIVDAGTED